MQLHHSMAFSVSIVIFYVETLLCKGHVFQLNIAEVRIKVFCATILSMGTLKYLVNPTIGISKSVLYQ